MIDGLCYLAATVVALVLLLGIAALLSLIHDTLRPWRWQRRRNRRIYDRIR